MRFGNRVCVEYVKIWYARDVQGRRHGWKVGALNTKQASRSRDDKYKLHVNYKCIGSINIEIMSYKIVTGMGTTPIPNFYYGYVLGRRCRLIIVRKETCDDAKQSKEASF